MKVNYVNKILIFSLLLILLACFKVKPRPAQGQTIKWQGAQTCPGSLPPCTKPGYETYVVRKGDACPDLVKCDKGGSCQTSIHNVTTEYEQCCCDPTVIPKPYCGHFRCDPSNDKCPPECPCHRSSDGNWCGASPTLILNPCDICGCKVDPKYNCSKECNEDCRKCITPDKDYKGGAWTALGCIPTGDFTEFTAWLLKRIIAVAGGIAFLLVIFGGFRIITSAGDSKRVQAATETITSALIGLLFIIFSIFLLELIGVKILGIPGF